MKQQKILSMETLKENKALLRNCSPEFYPYIYKVIKKLPEDVVTEQVLNDSSFSIMSLSKKSFGYCPQFEIPLKHLIVLNETVLDRPYFEIIHTIVHEIAHKVIGLAGTHLHEMEAEKLLVKWGFKKESKFVRYYRAIIETEGYKIGYDWAKTTNDQITLSCIEEFLDEWDQKGGFSPKRYDKLLYVANPSSIIHKNLSVDDEQELSKESIMNFDYLHRCVIWGILYFLKEKKCNERAKPPTDEKLDFMKQLKTIQIEISKIFKKHRALINNYDNLECNLGKANDKLERILGKLNIQIGILLDRFLLDNKEDV